LSPDGKTLATQADKYKKNPDGPDFEIEASTVKVWDVATGKELLSLGEVRDPHFRLLAFSDDGKSLLIVESPGPNKPRELQWWDVAPGQKKVTAELPPSVGRLTLSPDRKTFASGFAEVSVEGTNAGIVLGDARTGKFIQALQIEGELPHGLAFS